MLVMLPMISNMAMVKSILKMVITLLENIEMVNLMVMGNFIGIMVIFIKENLSMVNEMAKECGKVKPKKD